MRSKLLMTFCITASVICFSTPGWALVTSGSDISLDFRFNNPGARANAMGGAFIGVADDATAAYTNPAGLTILTSPEASIEYKFSENTFEVPIRNTATGLYDERREFGASTNGASFIGYASPSKNTTFTIYRHELLKISQQTSGENISFAWPALTPYAELDSELDISAITTGIGFGTKINDFFSVGFSIGFTEIDYFYQVDFTAIDQFGNETAWGTYSMVNSSDNGEQYTASVLVNPTENLNIGLIYRYGPDFETSYYDQQELRYLKNYIHVPDTYGIGTSYRFLNSLTVAVDINRVNYSDLLEDHYFYDYNSSGNPWIKNSPDFKIDDTTEIHVGFELVYSIGDTPMALRGGYYHRPDHSLVYTGPSMLATGAPIVYADRFVAGEDDNIYSMGLGMVLDENIQIDIAGSIGDLVEEYILSMVYRF